MGVGFAFVKGLVQGANNFQKSQADAKAAAAEDEKERLDMLGGLVFEAIGDGSLSAAQGANFLSRPEDQQSRKELARLLVKVKNVADTTLVGGLPMPWNHSGVTFEKGRADLEMTSMEKHLSDPRNMLAMVNEAKSNSGAVYDYFNRTNTNYFDYIAETRSSRIAGPGTEIKQRAIPNMTNMPNFMKIFDVLNTGKNNSTAISANSDKIINGVTEGRGVPAGSVVVKMGVKESVDENLQDTVVDNVVIMPLNTDDSNVKVTSDDFNFLATQLGEGRYESGSHMMLDTDFIKRKTLSSDPNVQFQSIRNAASYARFNPQDLDIANAVPTNNKTEIGMRLEAIEGANKFNFYSGDLGASVRSMVPHVTLAPEPVSGLVATAMTGAQLLESKDLDSKSVTETYTAANDAELMILELNKLEASLMTTPGVVRGLQKIVSGVVSEGGTLDQIFGFAEGFQGENNQFTTNLKEGISMGELTTRDSLRRIALANGVSGSFESKIGRIETLKINLAMKIARAADPSGRLSNQDFENALKTLGDSGFFSLQSKERQMAGLNQTLRNVKRKRESLEPYYKLLTKESITIEDRMQLIAFKRVQSIKDHMSRLRGASAGGTIPEAPGEAGLLVQPNAIVPPDNWQGTNATTLSDEGGGSKTYVFSIGDGVPLGWYQEQEDGTLISATEEQNTAILNQQKPAKESSPSKTPVALP